MGDAIRNANTSGIAEITRILVFLCPARVQDALLAGVLRRGIRSDLAAMLWKEINRTYHRMLAHNSPQVRSKDFFGIRHVVWRPLEAG